MIGAGSLVTPGATIQGGVMAFGSPARVVRSLIMTPGPHDWRGWVLHVSDDLGDEILSVPFASVLGKPH